MDKLGLKGGQCMKHGGGRHCLIDECGKGSQTGGKCIKHSKRPVTTVQSAAH